jgi:hypothetical protein
MATSVDGSWRIKKYGTHGASETLAGAFNAHRKSPSLVEASGDPLSLGKQMGDAQRLIRGGGTGAAFLHRLGLISQGPL